MTHHISNYVSGEIVAQAGQPLLPDVQAATIAEVVEALRTVFDPEIPVNVYDLGLIYDISIAHSGETTIQMTLTAPACPVAGELPAQVAQVAASVLGIGEVIVSLVWEPPWTPARMSEAARIALDMF